uniref:surface-adhesin E family protein n=1 Tax=Limnohabitans sp. TaxID=1907725 RepID=UPI0040475714
MFRSAKQAVHADYRSVTSHSYGHYIWILRNLVDDGRVKSEKLQIQIDCKERQYNVVSRHEFSWFKSFRRGVFASQRPYVFLSLDSGCGRNLTYSCRTSSFGKNSTSQPFGSRGRLPCFRGLTHLPFCQTPRNSAFQSQGRLAAMS